MSTDYVFFIHGVKTRNEKEFHTQAKILLDSIVKSIDDASRSVKPIYCFWGDINVEAQKELIEAFNISSTWKELWFRDFRTEQILEFVGDTALYLSRHVGAQVVRRIWEAGQALKDADTSDRLHLVTHSWGTVILFDILFARRWEDPKLDGDPGTQDIREVVGKIRNSLFGLTSISNPDQASRNSGIPLYSLQTMGSPLALFSLLNISGNVDGASTHDLTPRLNELLECLYKHKKKPLSWSNFVHPGDPIAYPLDGIIKKMLRDNSRFVNIHDVITDEGNFLSRPFTQKLLPILWGGQAHGSYWNSSLVAKDVSKVIRAAV
jgi:hypothetical protein